MPVSDVNSETTGESTVDDRRGWGTSRRAFLATGGTASVLSLVGCLGGSGADSNSTDNGSGDSPNEVVIGSNHPFTGSTSYRGQRLHNAVKLAAAIKNENGGIEAMDGAKVQVIKGDHKNDPSLGGEVTKELIEKGADVVTGCFSSSVTNAAVTAAEAQQVPFVIDVAVAASVLQERKFDYVYRPMPNSQTMATNCVENTLTAADAAEYDIETAAVFYLDETYGQSIRDGLRNALDERDIEIVAEKSIGYGETADTQVTAFRQADPDVLFPTVFTNQFLELTGSMNDQNYWPPIFAAAASSGTSPKNYEKIGSNINGMLSTGYEINRTDQRAQEVNERYMDTYDTDPLGTSAAMAFGTAQVIIKALEQAGSTDPEVLNRTLEQITVSDHVMAMPPISFNERGENENALATTNQVQDLQNQIVYPDQFTTAELDTETLVSN